MTFRCLEAMALAVLLVVGAAGDAAAQALKRPDQIAAGSVVEIKCTFDSGPPGRATGFVWSEPSSVVTALHAVAGCERVSVFAEKTGKSSDATVEHVLLEADLALLRLDRDIGLEPLQHSTEAPDATEDFVVWGYPQGTNRMGRVEVEFSEGQDGLLTSIERAIREDMVRALFAQQPYPRPETQIFPVASILRPGQSGAPIFDASGRIVAIVNGGLGGGVELANWSIPAFYYLPKLPGSADTQPTEPSRWAVQMSSRAADEVKTVPMTAGGSSHAASAAGPARFELLEQISVAELYEYFIEEEQDLVHQLLAVLPADVDWNDIGFDVYADLVTGATFAIPSGMEVLVHEELELVEALSADGTVHIAAGLVRAGSFDEAVQSSGQRFIEPFLDAADWYNSPAEFRYDELDSEWSHAESFDYYLGDDRVSGELSDVLLSLTIDGSNLLGYAAYVSPSEPASLDSVSAQIAGSLLTYFDSTLSADATEAEAELTLIQQISLLDLYTNASAEEQAILDDFIVLLPGPVTEEYAANLNFDVYMDFESGATLGVPAHLEMTWQPDVQALEGFTASGRNWLSVGINRSESFDDAITHGRELFVSGLAEYASWEVGPDSFDFEEVEPSWGFAQGFGAFDGLDTATSEPSQLTLSMTVNGTNLLGYALYATEFESFSEDDLVDYIMMQIAGSMLTAFSVQ